MRLDSTFKYRNLWLGFAMFLVLVCHSQFNFDSRLYATIQQFGYSGVDIFVFASGIGCYYSLEKDPDIFRFLKRRFRKLGPTYLCFIIPWMFWRRSQIFLPKSAIIGNILGLETFVNWDYHFNWYVGALILFYFLMPYLKSVTDSCRTLLADALVAVLLGIVSMVFWYPLDMNMVIYARLPILYLGAVVAKLGKRGVLLHRLHYVLTYVAAVVGWTVLQLCVCFLPDLLWWRGLYWYPFILIAPGVCLLLSWEGEHLRKYKPMDWLCRGLEWLGKYSFELYLVHIFLYTYLMDQITQRLSGISSNLLWFLSIPVVLLGAFLLNRAAALLSRVTAKTANYISTSL